MIRFTIYTYLFKPINEPLQLDAFSPEVNIDESVAKKQAIFGDIFKEGSKLKFHRGGEEYDHIILGQRDGIIVMQIANNRHQVHEREFNRWTEEDHPSLCVLIDNRKDKQVIAIENRQQAFSDPQTVANIMAESINRLIYHHRLEVQINAKYHTHEFWEVASEYDNGIASVTFKFPYPNLPEISDLVGEFYTTLAKKTNSEPKTTITAPPKEKLVLEEGDLMLERMISAASASGKLIMMRPKGSLKWRRIGLYSLVQEELSESVLKGLGEKELIPKKWQAIIDFMDKIQVVYA